MVIFLLIHLPINNYENKKCLTSIFDLNHPN